jgi:hypothetical protein
VLKETNIKVHVDKHWFHAYPVQNCLKQGDALSPLLFNFALEYTIINTRKTDETE